MDAQIAKMTVLLGRDAAALALATALVNAGIATPRAIKAAQDSAIEAIQAVGSSGLAVLRARWPVEEQ